MLLYLRNNVRVYSLHCCLCLRIDAAASERELNTDEEEEAKFKSGKCLRNVLLAPATRGTTVPFGMIVKVHSCGAHAVRTGVVQRPKDKILLMDPNDITYEMVQKKLQDIAVARGKTTRIDRQEQVGCSWQIKVQLQPSLYLSLQPDTTAIWLGTAADRDADVSGRSYQGTSTKGGGFDQRHYSHVRHESTHTGLTPADPLPASYWRLCSGALVSVLRVMTIFLHPAEA